jgi:hypothetical protein
LGRDIRTDRRDLRHDISTGYTTGVTSGPIGGICALIAATFIATCVTISESKSESNLGEERRRRRNLLPVFSSLRSTSRKLHPAVRSRQPTDSSIHFRYSALPSSIAITMHSGKS